MSECKYSFLEAKAKLEALCAYQERCEYDLLRKLRDWKFSEDDSNALIADLITNNFLSEERYAEAYVSGKVRIKKWGRIKIKAHLKQKSISNYSIQKAFDEIDEVEYMNNLHSLTKRKLDSLKKESDSYVLKAKLIRYLNSKGYENDLIYSIAEDYLLI